MRCEEIQEGFVDLLYDERGAPPANSALRAHLDACPSCSAQLEDLRAVRGSLRVWADEAPPASVRYIAPVPARRQGFRRSRTWRYVRAGALAASIALAFLALANAEISFSREGLSFRTHLFPRETSGMDASRYYTREEVLDLIKRVADDSEARLTEGNYLMIQRMLEIIGQQQERDFMVINSRLAQLRSRN